MVHHLGRCLPVAVRIDLVQSVGQHSYRGIAMSQRLPVGTDIDTVCQSADNEHLRTLLAQIGDETADEILSVSRHPTGADKADDPLLVQVCLTFIIEDDGCIGTLCEPLGVVIVIQCESPYAVLLHESHLTFCPPHRLIPVL